MTRAEITDLIINAISTARNKKRVSRAYMAKALGVSTKTIENYEMGYAPIPTVILLEWFKVLNEPILPYVLTVLYPQEFNSLCENNNDEQMRNALHTYVDTANTETIRKECYVHFGNHGSSFDGVLEMVTAHLHSPLRERLNVASNILANYEVARCLEETVCTDHVQPNTEVLKASIKEGTEAVKARKHGYNLI